MYRLFKSRVAAARMALRGIEDPAARAIASNAQAVAIAELAARLQAVHNMFAEARASLVSIASNAPWSPGDLEKVLDALTKTDEVVTKKWRAPQVTTQVLTLSMASSSNQQ